MPLETATYISQLVASNPVETDNAETAADHLRLIKGTLLGTFPSIKGVVNISDTALNAIAGGYSEYASFGGLGLGAYTHQAYTLTGASSKTVQLSFSAPVAGVVLVMSSANFSLASYATQLNLQATVGTNQISLAGDNISNTSGLSETSIVPVPANTPVTLSSTFGISAPSGTPLGVGHGLSYLFIPS